MPSILFVCTANQIRSPLAAACLSDCIQQNRVSGDWVVESAGTWAIVGLPVPELVRQLANELSLQGLENHSTRQVSRELLSRYDLCIVMEAGQKEALWVEFPILKRRIFMLSEIATGIQYDIPDPAARGVDPNEVAHELKMLISKGLDKIIRLAESLSAESKPIP